MALSNRATELFILVLEELNIRIQKAEYLQDRRILIKQIEEQQLILSKVRKLFLEDKLKFDDFKELKIECQTICNNVGMELNSNAMKLRLLEKQFKEADRSLTNIFYSFSELEIVDKKYIVSLITPVIKNTKKGTISMKFNKVLTSILSFKKSPETFEAPILNNGLKNFTERKVLVRRAIAVMAKNNIQINEDEAVVILDLLYRIAKTYNMVILRRAQS